MKDRRCFGRYEQSGALTFLFGNQSFSAKMIDYSLSGLAAKLEGHPPLKQGDVLNFSTVQDSEIDHGKVAWVRRDNGSLKVGLNKIGMLRGTLRQYALADVLIGAHRAMKTGHLYVIDGEAIRTLTYKGGDIIFATSNHPSEGFLDSLVIDEIITPEQFRLVAGETREAGSFLGSTLVKMGFMEQERFDQAKRRYVADLVMGMFRLYDAEFIMKDLPDVSSEDSAEILLSPSALSFNGIKQLGDIEHLLWLTPKLDSVIALSEDPLDLYQAIMYNSDDRAFLELVDSKRTLSEILAALKPVGSEAMRTALALLSTHIIEAREPGFTPRHKVQVDDVVMLADTPDPEGFVEEIDFLFTHHEDIGYYGVLGLKRETATAEEIDRSYHQKSRLFHPDRHYGLPEHTREKLNAIFEYLKTAYKVLSNPTLRAQYDSNPISMPVEKNRLNLAKQRSAEGRAEFNSGHYLNAAKLFEEASLLNNSVPDYVYNAAISYFKSDRLRDAETAIKRAMKVAPTNATYMVEAGFIYLALNLPLRAKVNFEKALSLEPASKRAAEGLALASKKK